MTAGEVDNSQDSISAEGSPNDNQSIPNEIFEIFEFLSFNEEIVFKSQQIDDPDLERSEKVKIAMEIYGRSKKMFLQRFGSHFQQQHLEAFGRLFDGNWNNEESAEEIKYMILGFQRKLETRHRDIKNRRYTHMQHLIKQGDYFSELEMMNRAPELYQELVGQYLSEEEKRQRDSYDVKNTTFSGILMHSLEQQQRDKMLKEADAELEKELVLEPEEGRPHPETPIQQQGSSIKIISDFIEEVEDDDSSDVVLKGQQNECETEYEVPQTCRQQWGNFDNENIACSTSRIEKEENCSLNRRRNLVSTELITAGERDLLRQEFVGIMQERFLAGKDSNFDYSLIDDNTQLDDLLQLNQDKEDEYFDDSEDDIIENTSQHVYSESEDELDVYMRHLNQHHSLKT